LTAVNVTQTKQGGVSSRISAEQRLLAIRAAGGVERTSGRQCGCVSHRCRPAPNSRPRCSSPSPLMVVHRICPAVTHPRPPSASTVTISTARCRPLGRSAESSLRLGAWPIEPWRRLGRDPYGGLRSHRVDPGSIWSD
jgi:hypothetical protein